MQAPETELKFTVPDTPAFHADAKRLGLTLKTPRTFEGNTLFDTPDRQLRAKRQILRLRQYGDKHVVTHKRLPDTNTPGDDRYKVRIETETVVEDGPAIAEVFCQLGFPPAFRYEKYRTEWDIPATDTCPAGHLVLDETPIGTWAELEGDPAWIEGMLIQLNVSQDRCTVESYGMLFLHWKERNGHPAQNLTFAEISPQTTHTTPADEPLPAVI